MQELEDSKVKAKHDQEVIESQKVALDNSQRENKQLEANLTACEELAKKNRAVQEESIRKLAQLEKTVATQEDVIKQLKVRENDVIAADKANTDKHALHLSILARNKLVIQELDQRESAVAAQEASVKAREQALKTTQNTKMPQQLDTAPTNVSAVQSKSAPEPPSTDLVASQTSTNPKPSKNLIFQKYPSPHPDPYFLRSKAPQNRLSLPHRKPHHHLILPAHLRTRRTDRHAGLLQSPAPPARPPCITPHGHAQLHPHLRPLYNRFSGGFWQDSRRLDRARAQRV
jgi:uncharacterized coiled-coil protein SlyX